MTGIPTGRPLEALGDYPDRHSIPRLHAHVRAAILNGALPPGTKISQVSLAQQLGVSRTPVREVLRMLQEEGLVEFSPNQRMRVAGLDPENLDSDYACRLLLETMAMSLTVPDMDSELIEEARSALDDMWEAMQQEATERWFDRHRDFHAVLTSSASPSLRRQLHTYSDRSTRYLQIFHPKTDEWQRRRHPEHVSIFEAVAAGDQRTAVERLANHLGTAALFVLDLSAPGYQPHAVPAALAMLTGGAVPVGS